MKQLLPYQVEAVEFASKRRGTLIADEMGLGKTVQAIGIINANPEIRSVIITCPKSLVLNWWNEIDSWVVLRQHKGKEGNLSPTNITVLNFEQLDKLKIVSNSIDLLIVDEAHAAKNPKSIRHRQIKKLAKISKKVVFLSGTPIENKPIELFPLLQILNPEKWDPAGWGKVGGKKQKVEAGEGANFFSFAKRYCGAHKERHGKKFHWVFDGSSNLEELNENLRKTCMIRRTKAEVLSQLPEKRHQVIVLPSTSSNDDNLLKDLNEDNFEVLISKLRADKIAFTEYSKRRHEQGLEKVGMVVEHVQNCLEESKKIIMFAHHQDVVEALAESLNFSGCLLMTSDMNVSERQKAVDDFQNDDQYRVILGSIGVMGVGWTLHASAHVIFAECDPVPGRMAQCADRAHRIGQKRNVLVQYLVSNGSLDARICKIFVKKQKVLNVALDSHGMMNHELHILNELGMIVPPPKPCYHPHSAVVAKGAFWQCNNCNAILR